VEEIEDSARRLAWIFIGGVFCFSFVLFDMSEFETSGGDSFAEQRL